MIYGYIAIFILYLIIFIVSGKENVDDFQKQGNKKGYPGEILFLKAAVWFLRKKKRHHRQAGQSQLGKKLKLLHPDISEKYQVREFYVRQ